MKKHIWHFVLVLLNTSLFSQPPGVTTPLTAWTTTAGVQAMFQKNITKTDGSGNIYTAGATLNANGKYDVLLTKTTSGGTLVYSKILNGTSNDQDFALGLALNGTDCYITGTMTNGTVTPIPELFLARFDATGVQQFLVFYSGGYGDVGKDLVVNTTYGACVVTGATYNSGFITDMVAVSFDLSSGAQNWVNGYGYPAGLNDAGIKIGTRGNNITITSAVTVAANQYKLVTTSYTLTSGWGTGTVTAGAIATSSVEIISDMVQDAAGNMYFIGATQQNAGQGYDMYVAKVTSSLTIAWEQTINGFSGSSLDDFGKGIQIDASSNVYVSGVTTHSTQAKNLTVVKLNSSGVVQWTKNINNSSFNGDDGGEDLALDGSNNIYATGYQTISSGNTDIYSVKLDNSTGNIIWEKRETSPYNDLGTNIIMSGNSVIIAASHEVTPGTFEYMTYQYDQVDVTTPTDFNLEAVGKNFRFFYNKGQLIGTNDTLVPDVKFYSYNTTPKFYFRDKTQSYLFSKTDTSIVTVNDTLHRIDLSFNSSLETAKTYALEEQHDRFLNYFFDYTLGSEAAILYGNNRLITTNLYNNIDLMTSSNQNGIKYYYIVKPGGDMRDIKLEFTGATSYSLNGTTNYLTINSSVGSITFDKPVAYQLTSANATVAVTSFSPTWQTNGASNKYKFNPGTYTSSLTLVIEVDQGNGVQSVPTTTDNVYWSTYIGGSDQDYYRDGTFSKDSSYYTTGYTYSSSFPKSPGQQIVSNFADIMVTQFDKNGHEQWTTQFGAGDNDFGQGVATDNNNKVIVVGQSYSINMPLHTPSGAYTHTLTSQPGSTWADGVMMRLKPQDGSVEWSTFVGGTGTDEFLKVAVNSVNNIYVVGRTEAYNFPYYGSNGFNQSFAGNLYGEDNGLIIKFNSSLYPVASTGVGTAVTNSVLQQLAIDKHNDDVVVVGTGFGLAITTPTTGHPFSIPTPRGNYEGVILKYNSSNVRLWSTYFSGSMDDHINTVDINDSGEVYIGGQSWSTDLPHKYYNYPNGHNDTIKIGTTTPNAFFARFNRKDSLLWSCYYKPGNRLHEITDIEIDKHQAVFFTATNNLSGLTALPHPTGAFYHNTPDAWDDGFIGAIAYNGVNTWGTFFGGNGYDVFRDISYNGNDRIYFCGSTNSNANYPLANNNNLATIYATRNGPYDGTAGFLNILSDFVGIRELSLKSNAPMDVLVYPNPTKDELNIIVKENSLSLNYEIFDIQGKMVANGIVQNSKVQLPNLSSGMYIISLKNNKGIYTQKFIKE